MKTGKANHDCCTFEPNKAAAPSTLCPSCGRKGKLVKRITIESLVNEEARARVGHSEGFRFCPEPACDVAYFHPETGARFLRGDVRVRIGQKEESSPRPLCYCFNHTIEDIEADVAATGSSRIPDSIVAKCHIGLDRCEETNPQGSCCVGNVQRVLKEAQARNVKETSDGASSIAPDTGDDKNCCIVKPSISAPTGKARKAGLWATGGAMVSAVLSSACCWLPLLLIAFGTSSAGVAGFFEAYRPYLLGATGLLLASSFYFVYFRKERCAPGEACAVPNSGLKRFNKVMLWVATIIVTLFALFPNYVGFLLGGDDGRTSQTTAPPGESRVYRIVVTGMTCEGCAHGLASGLHNIPGVRGAEVDYKKGLALVTLNPEGNLQSILEAIKDHGYMGKVENKEE